MQTTVPYADDIAARPIPAQALPASAVSWGAVLAGAMVAAIMSLVLLVLGTGLGLVAVSPWANDGVGASALGVGAIVWLIGMQLVSAALGGYVAGRLRTRWPGAQADEVFFRDTAHGFLVWAVATALTASLLASAAASVVAGSVKAAAGVGTAALSVAGAASAVSGFSAAGERSGASNSPTQELSDAQGTSAYFADRMLRPDVSTTAAVAPTPTAAPVSSTGDDRALRAEIGRFIAANIGEGELSAEDRRYLGQRVAAHTGLSQELAEKRVTDVVTQAKRQAAEFEAQARSAADEARRVGANASLWLFVSLMVGAFVGSYAGTIGGRQRDLV